MRHIVILRVQAVLLGVAVVLLAILLFRDGQSRSSMTFDTPYQAVLLTNGQVLFGRLENAGAAFPVLTDVYYVSEQVRNAETNQITNVLVKRGAEWHAPQRTILNARNILLIEPVMPDSSLARRLAQLGKG